MRSTNVCGRTTGIAPVPGADAGEIRIVAHDEGCVTGEGEVHDQVVLVVLDVEALARWFDYFAARGRDELEHRLNEALYQPVAGGELTEHPGQIADDMGRDMEAEIITVEGERKEVGRRIADARWHVNDSGELGAGAHEGVDVDVNIKDDRWPDVRWQRWSAGSFSRAR